jgi:hypothetical protein
MMRVNTASSCGRPPPPRGGLRPVAAAEWCRAHRDEKPPAKMPAAAAARRLADREEYCAERAMARHPVRLNINPFKGLNMSTILSPSNIVLPDRVQVCICPGCFRRSQKAQLLPEIVKGILSQLNRQALQPFGHALTCQSLIKLTLPCPFLKCTLPLSTSWLLFSLRASQGRISNQQTLL